MPLVRFAEEELRHRTIPWIWNLCDWVEDSTGIRTCGGLANRPEEPLQEMLAAHARINLPEMKEVMALQKKILHLREIAAGSHRQSPLHRQSDRSRSPPARTTQSVVKPELWAAVEEGNSYQCLALLLQNKDINEQFESWTPLMKAADEDHAYIALLLLDMNADMNVCDKRGRTALSLAAAPSDASPECPEKGCDTLRFLLEKGADTRICDKDNLMPRERAALAQREMAIAVFDEFGVPPG